jgi:hypothetical protein
MNKIEDLQQYLETQKSIPENNMAEATMKVVEMLKKVETEFKKVNPEAKIVYEPKVRGSDKELIGLALGLNVGDKQVFTTDTTQPYIKSGDEYQAADLMRISPNRLHKYNADVFYFKEHGLRYMEILEDRLIKFFVKNEVQMKKDKELKELQETISTKMKM